MEKVCCKCKAVPGPEEPFTRVPRKVPDASCTALSSPSMPHASQQQPPRRVRTRCSVDPASTLSSVTVLSSGLGQKKRPSEIG